MYLLKLTKIWFAFIRFTLLGVMSLGGGGGLPSWGVCLIGGSASRQTPLPGYGQSAGITHHTGMHTCTENRFCKTKVNVFTVHEYFCDITKNLAFLWDEYGCC